MPVSKSDMALEEFRDVLKGMQEGSPDNTLREIRVETLGEQERAMFEKLQQGILDAEEIIAAQDAAIGDSQKLFYRYLGARLSDRKFGQRLTEEQTPKP